jgi:tetratricopeptide (TPR) repeat protein
MKKFITKLIVFLQCILFSYSANAIEFYSNVNEDGTMSLILNGNIVPNDSLQFSRILKSFEKHGVPVQEIVLNSGGGDVIESAKMAQSILKRNISTLVLQGDTCASACVLLFASGYNRTIYSGAKIGVHRVSSGEQDDSFARYMSINMNEVYKNLGVPDEIRLAMLDTPPDKMHWLKPKEMQLFASHKPNLSASSQILSSGGIVAPLPVITKGDRSQARALNKQAIQLIRSGQYQVAIAKLEKAKSIYPSDSEVLGNLGYAYYMVGNYSQAQMNLTTSLKLSPKRGATWNNLGLVLASTNQIEWATKCFVNYWSYSGNKRAATNQFFYWEQEVPGSGIDIASKRARAVLNIIDPIN